MNDLVEHQQQYTVDNKPRRPISEVAEHQLPERFGRIEIQTPRKQAHTNREQNQGKYGHNIKFLHCYPSEVLSEAESPTAFEHSKLMTDKQAEARNPLERTVSVSRLLPSSITGPEGPLSESKAAVYLGVAQTAGVRTLRPIAYPGFAINPGQIVWPLLAQSGSSKDELDSLLYYRFLLKADSRGNPESSFLKGK